MSAPARVPATLHLLLVAPAVGTVDAALAARLARWLGRAGVRPAAPGLARDHVAGLAGLSAPVAWAEIHAGAGPLSGQRHWLWLEPVRMQVGMNNVAMAPPAAPLGEDQLDTLRVRLAPLFDEAGAHLGVAAGRLLAGFRTPLAVRCTAPEAAYGTILRDCLPAGQDAGALRRLMTECQMLLHQQEGEAEPPPVNAVWPWGNGEAPRPKPAAGLCLSATDPLLSALARLTGAAVVSATALERALAQGPLPGSALVVCADPADGALDGLLDSAEQALRQGRLATIQVRCWPALDAAGVARAATLSRWTLLRVWRRPDPPWKPGDA